MTLDTVEAHVFCGPEFVLEVPPYAVGEVLVRSSFPASSAPGAGWQVSPSCLLTFQTELLYLCSPLTRRRIHRSEVHPLAAGGEALVYPGDAFFHTIETLPAPPGRLQYLQVKSPAEMNAEEESALTQSVSVHRRQRQAPHEGSTEAAASCYCLLQLTDSRMAAEVYWLCLRNHAIALSHGCHVFSYFRSSALRSAPVASSELLARREALRRRWNLDVDLWAALEAGMVSPALEVVKQKAAVLGSRQTGPVSAETSRLTRVQALLAYCEAHVEYASVLDENEDASPFLLAMGLFLEWGLTFGDLAAHFVRHPRRVVRALALFLARYLLPPEELAPFFFPVLDDGVAIAAGPPVDPPGEPVPLREIARRLLLQNEVGEAWLPALHEFWLETVVRPALGTMSRLQEAQTAARRGGEAGQVTLSRNVVAQTTPFSTEAPCALERRPAVGLKGTGRGVAALGFHSLADICRFARAKRARTLVPQRMATLVARTQRRDVVEMDADDDDDDDDKDEQEDFLISVEVASAGELPEVTGGLVSPRGPSVLRPVVPMWSSRPAASSVATSQVSYTTEEKLDPHVMILKEGYRTVLSLLCRTTPFDADERFLQF